jgi:hypothetical protein
VTAFSNLPVKEIRQMDAIHLGSGGFCFLVAESLIGRFPEGVLYRLTDRDRREFFHVFVSVSGARMDIKGVRSIADMRFDYRNAAAIEEPVDIWNVRKVFYPQYSIEQLCAARAVIEAYIDSHADIFQPGADSRAGGVFV